MTRSLQPILLALVAALALAVGACGGGGDEASSDTDVNTLLTDTFKGNKDVKSGKLNLALKVDAKGGTSSTQGPISVSVSGPFQTEGKQKLPKFDIDFAFEGAGQSIKAGLTSTGDQGLRELPGHRVRGLRPGLPAVQGRLRAGAEERQLLVEEPAVALLARPRPAASG